MTMTTNRNTSPSVVRFAPGIYERMLASVGALAPEHYAVLGGRLDDPFHVTDFMPMPPLMNQDGSHQSSTTAVTLNGPFIEYFLNTSLLPFGKYILGVMHSHPGNMNRLSNGAAGSGQGDIPSMRGHLEAAARFGEPWHNFIAPIVTNPGPSPHVDTWIVRLDTPDPIRCETVWETEAPTPAPPKRLSKQDELLALASRRPDLIRRILDSEEWLRPLARSRRAGTPQEAAQLLDQILRAHKGPPVSKAERKPYVLPVQSEVNRLIGPQFGPIT